MVTSVPAFALNAVLGNRSAPNNDRFIRQMASNRGVLFVHGVAAGYQRDHVLRAGPRQRSSREK